MQKHGEMLELQKYKIQTCFEPFKSWEIWDPIKNILSEICKFYMLSNVT